MNHLVRRYEQLCARLGDIRVHRAQLELEAGQLEREALAIQAALRLNPPSSPAPLAQSVTP
jgi:hypothetical protein